MYLKSKGSCNKPSSVSRKRKFYANRYTEKNDDDLNASSSRRKLSSSSAENVIVDSLFKYRILNFLTVFGALS